MSDSFSIADILPAMDAWEIQRVEFLSNLSRARQPEPTADAMTNFRDIFIESWLRGRTSK